MKIVIIGNVCVDKNSVEGAEYEFFGGPASYISVILKKFKEAQITIISNYGEDFEKYKKMLNVQMVPNRPNRTESLQYKNIVVDGKRTQYAINYNGSSEITFDAELVGLLREADILLFAPIVPDYQMEDIEQFTNVTSKDCIKIVLPQGFFREFDSENKVIFRDFKEVKELSKAFDFMILSDEDYPDVLELAKEWSSDCKVIVTRGKNGADLYEFGEILNIPTKEVRNIKDSTGSGDVFSGSFAYKFAETKDEIKSIQFANKIAGICLRFTPMEMIEKLEIDEDF